MNTKIKTLVRRVRLFLGLLGRMNQADYRNGVRISWEIAKIMTVLFAFSGCDRSMNDSWLNPPSCHKKECMEAEGYNIMGSPGQ